MNNKTNIIKKPKFFINVNQLREESKNMNKIGWPVANSNTMHAKDQISDVKNFY